jgi:Flp pilus assembly protein TadG
MTIVYRARGFRSLVRRLARERDGVSAVEFALVLPIMLTLYLGGVELGDGMAISFKTTLAARTVTDVASLYTSIDSPTMSQVLGAASKVLSPYPTGNVVVTLSEINANSSGQGTVTWSCSLNGSPRQATKPITLPTAMQQLPSATNMNTSSLYLLLGEVTYPYTPSIGYAITGTINITQTQYFFPRLSTSITSTAATLSTMTCSP